MIRKPLIGVCVALLLAHGVVGAWASRPAAPPAATPAENLAAARMRVKDLDQRLGALDPAQPEGYFLLAEDLAAERQDPACRALARQLYALAGLADHRAARPSGLLRPVCLGLAELASSQSEKRWLRAMALQAGTDDERPDPKAGNRPRASPAEVTDRLALELATVLGYVRSGEGRRAQRLMERPGVTELLQTYQDLLDESGLSGGADRVIALAAQYPFCTECRNRRVVSVPGDKNRRFKICPRCAGVPGPRLETAEVLSQLRLESALLKGIHRLWSAQLAADGDRPLLDPDPEELAARLRLDPAAMFFRDGVWTSVNRPLPTPASQAPAVQTPPPASPADRP